MSARKVCSGMRPSRFFSVRVISPPFRRSETRTFTPSALLCIEFRLAELCDVQANIRDHHAEQLRRFLAQLLDVLALLADHDARTRSLDRDVHFLRGPLDVNAAHRRFGQLGPQEATHPEIGEHVLGELLLAGIPLRRPIASDTEAYAQRIDLLTHG